MTNEPSPRPWRMDEYDASLVRDADGRFVARADAADAALILAAVNERDRLRDLVRRTVETLEQVYKHADMTDALREVVAETQREALAALGEGETPTGTGVGV